MINVLSTIFCVIVGIEFITLMFLFVLSSLFSLSSDVNTEKRRAKQEKRAKQETRAKEIMVLIGCEKDAESRLIKRNNNGQSEFIIPSENVIGFVDLDTKYFNSNPNSEYSIGIGQNL